MTAIAHAPTAARWWHLADNDKVVCTLCPRHCHIPNGSRGFCFVRANVDNKLELTTYGRSSGFCIDPVEKKPLNHFLPGTPTLSFGTAGCNLGCKFCQNWDISKSREMDTLAQSASPEAIVAAALRTDSRSLSFTYNDPVIWAEYAIDIAKVARAHGIKTIAVTAGYIDPSARAEFYSHMDAANVDLKGFTENFYDKLCQSKLAPVLDTLKFLKHETNVWFELTNLMIPGENDSESETKEMCDWIVNNIGPDVPIHFTAFHPDFKMRETPPTPPRTLVRAREIAKAAGIRYAYVGNVNDVENQSTYCHCCGELLIERDWYKLGKYHLRGAHCAACGTLIPGVFDEKGPGTWGPKRQRVTINEEPMQITSSAASLPAKTSTEFSREQDAEVLAYTKAVIEATLLSQPFLKARLPEPIANAPSYGVFVSLFRGEQLRSCKGQLGEIRRLGDHLPACARDALSQDPRFPRVTPAELAYLTVEVSFLQPPEKIEARGDDRIAAVRVGEHGLIISHPAGQGLLLPHVATEQNWDARTFLEQVCRKAGLAANTWRDDAATILTFRARKIEAPPQIAGVSPQMIEQRGFAQLAAIVEQITRGSSAQPLDAPVLQKINAEVLGICVRSATGVMGLAISPGKSLADLAASAAQSLAMQLKQRGRIEPLQEILFLWQALPLVAADYPSRHGHLAGAAVLAQSGSQWSLHIGQPGVDSIAAALAGIKVTHRQWLDDRSGAIQLMAFNAFHCRMEASAVEEVRPAARAGMFYPADAAQVRLDVDRYLAAGGYRQVAAQKFRAIMLPHAGWQFCGSTIGKTLAGVQLPQTAIIIGPHHTAAGSANSVASQKFWQIPGATIPVDSQLAQRLARAVPNLALEQEAHRQEHGSEVLLPFLHRMRPDLRIVPIVVGQCSQETVMALARELGLMISEAGAANREPPLLIISSDMNHFATDAENRRLDALAIEAMQTGNPQRLLDACTKNQISMCGLMPAVSVMLALKSLTPTIRPRLIDYTTSAVASGDFNRVVGYAGVVIE